MHSFDPDIAARVGVNAAVLYQNILWWCQKNAANQRHIHDGKAWSYNSRAGFTRLFPYLTDKQIRGALDRLVAEGLIEVGNFNERGADRTKWYTIGPLGQMDWPSRANGSALQGQALPVINPDGKPDDSPPAALGGRDGFAEWWALYPKKVGKGAAEKAFAVAVKKISATDLLARTEIQKRHWEALGTEARFIPHPATWLNQRRFEDEVDAVAPRPAARRELAPDVDPDAKVCMQCFTRGGKHESWCGWAGGGDAGS